MFKFSKSSLQKLNTVEPQLQLLAHDVLKISPYDFAITCGYRTQQEQMRMYAKKVSKCDGIYNKSKHQLGKAIDIMIYDKNGICTWEERYYVEIANIFKKKAQELNINIRWGGDFEKFFDGPHFELL